MSFPWKQFIDRGNLAGTALDGTVNDSLSDGTQQLDNRSNLDTHAQIEIFLNTFTPATPGDCYIELYARKSRDGVNFEQIPVIQGLDVNSGLGPIPIVPGSGVVRRVMLPYLLNLGPYIYEFYVGNQTNGTFAVSANEFNVSSGVIDSV